MVNLALEVEFDLHFVSRGGPMSSRKAYSSPLIIITFHQCQSSTIYCFRPEEKHLSQPSKLIEDNNKSSNKKAHRLLSKMHTSLIRRISDLTKRRQLNTVNLCFKGSNCSLMRVKLSKICWNQSGQEVVVKHFLLHFTNMV